MRNPTEKGSTVAISIYDQFVPVFTQMLSALDKVLSKAEADATARKIDLEVFVNGRLAPDMLPLTRQIQIMTDQAKGCASRLAGQESPKWADDEKTFADLHARIAKTIAHLKSFKPEQFEGAEKRSVICVVIAALCAADSRSSAANRRPIRRAGITKIGNKISDSSVICHDSRSITTNASASEIAFDTTPDNVHVNARWAPITSLLRRLTSAPVRVRMKNATGIF